MITIIGLGPGDPNLLTLQARGKLNRAREILVRTRKHPALAALPKHLRLRSFDALYKKRQAPEAINRLIAEAVMRRAERGTEVIYAVPGHPLFGEPAVQSILAQAREHELPVEMIAGVSFVDAAIMALGLDPLAKGLQIADATDLAREHFPRFDTDRPALIGHLASRALARAVQATLLVNYAPAHPIVLVHAAGTPEQTLHNGSLGELDRATGFGLTTLYLPPTARASSPLTLAELMAHLRAPEGCPWDREQTPESLRASLLEEVHEVLDAIDAEDAEGLREELGDLFLHILFQTEMAREAGKFTLSDVGAELAAKLIRRHPHVFGDEVATNAEQVLANWHKIKAKEKADKGKEEDWLAHIPRGLPALTRAQKIYRHLERERISADDTSAEIRALEKSLRGKSQEHALGKILFVLVALAEDKHLDAESALRKYATEAARTKK